MPFFMASQRRHSGSTLSWCRMHGCRRVSEGCLREESSHPLGAGQAHRVERPMPRQVLVEERFGKGGSVSGCLPKGRKRLGGEGRRAKATDPCPLYRLCFVWQQTKLRIGHESQRELLLQEHSMPKAESAPGPCIGAP